MEFLKSLNEHVTAAWMQVQYGYKHDFIGYCVLILCGFILLFQAINSYALKNFNFQTR